jgi:hypothetical protein
MQSLNNYITELTYRLKDAVPAKHANHPDAYHNFLKHEIEMAKAKIEAAKLEGTK